MEKDIVNLPFGTFRVYPDFVVGEPEANVEMGIEKAKEVASRTLHNFDKPFGYIGNRINVNSLDPMAYLFVTREYPLFKVMAVVSYSSIGSRFLETERLIAEHVDLHFETFRDLPSAKAWVTATLKLL